MERNYCFILQPAEEIGFGARQMINAGLFKQIPYPDINLALHVSAQTQSGTVHITPGFAMANVDSVDVTFYGEGGHGAYPHLTKDPIVMSSQFITSVQTIISRNLSPINAGVVTVGSIHGGTKHNIIPNHVDLQITVRSYSDEDRELIISRIKKSLNPLLFKMIYQKISIQSLSSETSTLLPYLIIQT